MSQEHAERVREVQDAANRGDRAAFLALCDPDLENVPSRDWPESAPVRGREAVWDFLTEGQQFFDGALAELSEVLDAPPNTVIANQRARLRGAASGVDVDWSFWIVVSFRDDKAVRFEWFTHRDDALEAAGLSE
jgi:ketosteroid isomerase-like protein